MKRSKLNGKSDLLETRNIDLGGLTGLLGYQIRQAQTASFRDLQKRFRELGITPGEFSLLTILRDNPQIRQTDLVDIYGLNKSTLSVAVKRLVDRALVDPCKLVEDRRFHGLSLTPNGELLLVTATKIIDDQEKRMAHVLSPREKEIVIRALRHIAGALTRD